MFKLIMFTAGCGVSPAMLTNSEGTFGISETQYEDNLRCRWNIQVETTKVGSSRGYTIYTCCDVAKHYKQGLTAKRLPVIVILRCEININIPHTSVALAHYFQFCGSSKFSTSSI